LENGVRPKTSSNTQDGEYIALLYITYLASNEDKLGQFCSLSGLGQDDIRARLLDPSFQAFLLDTLLQDESELLAFAENQGLKPSSIMTARSKLPGFTHDS
jgi:Protein of unknown function (DUF3572)